ncbi:MAG TPA: ribonuclease PH [Oligoflexia bacterium]|nr:ribonuclease PH [Oligoflexia bacterium]
MPTIERSFNRGSGDLRPVKITTGVNAYAEGSVMVEFGGTKVLVTASVEESVPAWLKGKGQGWITSEYGMLPRATHTRSKRERDKLSGRTHEIQRLIGRALRTCIDLGRVGERTIMVDCDVIQADGGTRTASITGGYVALALAMKKLAATQAWNKTPIIEQVASVSVGLKNGEVLVDLDYKEDSSCEVDMNFVMTASGLFVEIQGTAEHKPFSQGDMQKMTASAMEALAKLHQIQKDALL